MSLVAHAVAVVERNLGKLVVVVVATTMMLMTMMEMIALMMMVQGSSVDTCSINCRPAPGD